MDVNNTNPLKFYVMSPGDEVWYIYNWYPYSVPEAIVVESEKSYTYITIDLHAKEESWTLDNQLNGNKDVLPDLGQIRIISYMDS